MKILPLPSRPFARRGLYERFLVTMKQLGFKPGKPLLLALSGGRDSVTLLHLLRLTGYPVTAAHLNHQLRGKESRADEKFVRDLCQKWNVPAIIHSTPVASLMKRHHLSLEEAARIARYQFLEKTAARLKIHHVLTAHHQRDQAETILLKVFFGHPLHTLRGMEIQRPLPRLRWTKKRLQKTPGHPIHLLRPLLEAPAGEMELYARQNRLKFRTDRSNHDLSRPRNWIRHKLLPLVQKKLDRNIIRALAHSVGGR